MASDLIKREQALRCTNDEFVRRSIASLPAAACERQCACCDAPATGLVPYRGEEIGFCPSHREVVRDWAYAQPPPGEPVAVTPSATACTCPVRDGMTHREPSCEVHGEPPPTPVTFASHPFDSDGGAICATCGREPEHPVHSKSQAGAVVREWRVEDSTGCVVVPGEPFLDVDEQVNEHNAVVARVRELEADKRKFCEDIDDAVKAFNRAEAEVERLRACREVDLKNFTATNVALLRRAKDAEAENVDLALERDGLKHDRTCVNNAASPGRGDEPCLRCRVETLTAENARLRDVAEAARVVEEFATGILLYGIPPTTPWTIKARDRAYTLTAGQVLALHEALARLDAGKDTNNPPPASEGGNGV